MNRRIGEIGTGIDRISIMAERRSGRVKRPRDDGLQQSMERFEDIILNKGQFMVVSGSGLSAGCGIPTFTSKVPIAERMKKYCVLPATGVIAIIFMCDD